MKVIFIYIAICFLSWNSAKKSIHTITGDCIINLNFDVQSTVIKKPIHLTSKNSSKELSTFVSENKRNSQLNICIDTNGNCKWGTNSGIKTLSRSLLEKNYDGISYTVLAFQQSIGNSALNIEKLIKNAVAIGATKSNLGNGTISLRLYNKQNKTTRVLLIDTRKFTLLGLSDYDEVNQLKNKIIFSYITINNQRLIQKSTETIITEKDNKSKVITQINSLFKVNNS